MSARPAWLDALLDEEVHRRISADPRTRAQPDTFLGWPKDRIFSDVLGGGQADFAESVGHLCAEDRALLYARYNQPRHLDELGEAFDQLFAQGELGNPTIIDLGCGPFTAGLALAASLGPARPFRYHGFDRAPAMVELGNRFAKGAGERGAFHSSTTWCFGDDLDRHNFGRIRGDVTLFVASYLLASPTLDIDKLVSSMEQAARRIGPGPVAVLYTNSAKAGPNQKFPRFRDALATAGFEVVVDSTELFQKTRSPAALRYALFFRTPSITISVRTPKP